MSATSQHVYDFTVQELDGTDCSLMKYKGNVLLIVNTASKGINKKSLKGLHRLQEIFVNRPFNVLAFPCNQFFAQELKTNEKIKASYIDKHGYSFKVFSRIKVNGSDASPLFKWLKSKEKGEFGKNISGNFTYFLVDTDGESVQRFKPGTSWSKLAWKIEQETRAEEEKRRQQQGLPAEEEEAAEGEEAFAALDQQAQEEEEGEEETGEMAEEKEEEPSVEEKAPSQEEAPKVEEPKAEEVGK